MRTILLMFVLSIVGVALPGQIGGGGGGGSASQQDRLVLVQCSNRHVQEATAAQCVWSIQDSGGSNLLQQLDAQPTNV